VLQKAQVQVTSGLEQGQGGSKCRTRVGVRLGVG
jgi:hypothetical protein